MNEAFLKKLIPSTILEFLWSKINSIYYSGVYNICGMCNWNGHFLNNYCPKCKSLPRSRLLHYSLKNFKKNKKILHVGPSKNEVLFVQKNLKPTVYHKADCINNKFVNKIQDITKNGLEKNFYDLVIIWHVLEHIKDDTIAISNLYHSLKDSGIMVASVPVYPEGNLVTKEDPNASPKDYEELYGYNDHCRACGYDYKERFSQAGFKNISEVDARNLAEEEKIQYGLANHVAWIAEKI